MDRRVLVYSGRSDFSGCVGRLWLRVRGNRGSASFEYDPGWLQQPARFALDPTLELGGGAYYTESGRQLFGAFDDSAPDRWGRMLLRRAERRDAQREGRTPRTLSEADFLLGVDDETRQGALRFRETPEGPFLAPPSPTRVPPLVELPRLLGAADRVAAESEDDDDLRLLLMPGASLGGARPKASVRDGDGRLAFAKFPKTDDEWNVPLWEAVALALASRAGITTSSCRLETVSGRRVLVLHRFDREGGRRIPFLSAMTMLGATDHEPRSYPEIAEAIRRFGAAPAADLKELWRRIVFTVLISNRDDHLRNHGFLRPGDRGWRLSPAYDLNPTPAHAGGRFLATAIVAGDTRASLELAFRDRSLLRDYASRSPRNRRGSRRGGQRLAQRGIPVWPPPQRAGTHGLGLRARGARPRPGALRPFFDRRSLRLGSGATGQDRQLCRGSTTTLEYP